MSPADAQALVADASSRTARRPSTASSSSRRTSRSRSTRRKATRPPASAIGVVVLDTRLDDALRDLGYLRELLNRVQTARKEMGLDFVDRIRVRLAGSDRVMRIANTHEATIKSECLAVDLGRTLGAPDASQHDAVARGRRRRRQGASSGSRRRDASLVSRTNTCADAHVCNPNFRRPAVRSRATSCVASGIR